MKVGDLLYCESCGVELQVTKSCSCADCRITCCGKPMQRKSGSGMCCQ